MKFKVGDRVRYNREILVYTIQTGGSLCYTGIEGFEIIQTASAEVRSEDGLWFIESNLELVPEEPEFEFGEEIEVRDEIGGERKRVIFLCRTTANDTHQYITADISKKSFDNGARFHNNAWRFARKARPQLSRKKIAEKFGVSEDFTLVD